MVAIKKSKSVIVGISTEECHNNDGYCLIVNRQPVQARNLITSGCSYPEPGWELNVRTVLSWLLKKMDKARQLADALEKQGWSVWWDPKLRAGDYFDDTPH